MLSPVEHCDTEELLEFVYTVYVSTNGVYPFLEWLSKKPDISDHDGFISAYRPFLNDRINHEFDRLFVWKDEEIIMTVALVFNFDKKDISWFPQRFIDDATALIEFLMVNPKLQRKGWGTIALNYAIDLIKNMKKNAFLVTSATHSAYLFFKKAGFSEVSLYNDFVIMVHH